MHFRAAFEYVQLAVQLDCGMKVWCSIKRSMQMMSALHNQSLLNEIAS